MDKRKGSFINVYGVDFKAGINTETYKYFIDFAFKYKIPYILIDTGWAAGEDLSSATDGLDIEAVIKYGNEKGVGIILWTNWKILNDQMDKTLSQFERWGAKGIKVDYMRRDDQKVVNFYYKVAREAAKHKLIVDFHGCYKPTGLHRAYPNILTLEAVKGLESYKFPGAPATPEHNVTIPFNRTVEADI
jgi:alpha-glucosidase